MSIQKYKIDGMTCGACVGKVRSAITKIDGIESANIQLAFPQASLKLNQSISLIQLQTAIGQYKISPIETNEAKFMRKEEIFNISLRTYKPLLLIIGFIVGVTLLVQYPFSDFSWILWMRHFMAGFFLVFAFFKLLNIKGFASSYQSYDLLARSWKSWGYIYPFVELSLGILYLINIAPILTNWLTLIILGVSSIGVIQSVMDKRKIKCACLGDVFNLPMSAVTIIEDLSMVTMAGIMLLML